MAADLIWYIIMFACAALFVGIGAYARKRKEPMWFWTGSSVDPASVTDVKKYNRENARMWFQYSLWYWAAGFAWIWSRMLALTVLMLSCSVGIVILVRTFLKIEKKYKKTGL